MFEIKNQIHHQQSSSKDIQFTSDIDLPEEMLKETNYKDIPKDINVVSLLRKKVTAEKAGKWSGAGMVNNASVIQNIE